MGGSLGKSDSESESSSGFQQKVWPGQSSALGSLYNNVANLFNYTTNGAKSLTPQAISSMNQMTGSAVPAWQQQLSGGLFDGQRIQDRLMDSLGQSMNKPTETAGVYADIMGGEGNNYADALKSRFMNDAKNAYGNMMNTMDARAVGAGQSGSSRHGIVQAQGAKDINDALLNNMANVGYESFDKDLANKLSIAGMADQNTLARQQMLQQMLGNANQSQQYGLGAGSDMQNMSMTQFQPYSIPWSYASNYANAIGRPTVLGSGNALGSSDSKGLGLSAAFG